MKTTYDDEKRIAVLVGGQIVYSVHKSTQCFGDVCPIHAPSDHDLLEATLTYDPIIGSFFREVDGNLVIDPDDYNFNKYGTIIVENAIVCNTCGDRVVSTYRHHMASCSCGASFADGGLAYLRRGGSDWSEDSVVFHKEDV